jgi:formiminotetrahydrofolate cyclodeaminase
MSENWDEFDGWFNRVVTEPLPAGVAVAAVAAVMGAALVAKVSRLTLMQGGLAEPDQNLWKVALESALAQQAELRCLAKADEQAYRAVLGTKALAAEAPARQQTWQVATEVPIQVAEACNQLLHRVPGLLTLCQPALRVDLQIGSWLLAKGLQAGLAAAEVNLQAWGELAEAQPLRARVEALQEDKID